MIYVIYDFPMLSVFTIIDFSYFQDREAAKQRGMEPGMAVWKLMADEAVSLHKVQPGFSASRVADRLRGLGNTFPGEFMKIHKMKAIGSPGIPS